jgi:RNA polymerase sigma-70 factor (ECF subfamily)
MKTNAPLNNPIFEIDGVNLKGSPEPSTESDWRIEFHGDYLLKFALGRIGDEDVAKDLVQESFLAAIQSRTSFRGKSSLRSWLTAILRHKIYDHLRFLCRQRRLKPVGMEMRQEFLVWPLEAAANSQLPIQRMEHAEFREALASALGRLPTRLAEVFQLYEIEEQPHHEVCARLDISKNNLWVMLHRARRQLSKEFSEWRNNGHQSGAGHERRLNSSNKKYDHSKHPFHRVTDRCCGRNQDFLSRGRRR